MPDSKKSYYFGLFLFIGVFIIGLLFFFLNSYSSDNFFPFLEKKEEINKEEIPKVEEKKPSSKNKIIIISTIIIFFIAVIVFFLCYFFFWKENKENEVKDEEKIEEKVEEKVEAKKLYEKFKKSMIDFFRKENLFFLTFQKKDRKIIEFQILQLPKKEGEDIDKNEKFFLEENHFQSLDLKEKDFFFIASIGLIRNERILDFFNLEDEEDFKKNINDFSKEESYSTKKVNLRAVNNTNINATEYYFKKILREKEIEIDKVENKEQEREKKIKKFKEIQKLFDYDKKNHYCSPREETFEKIKKIKKNYPTVYKDNDGELNFFRSSFADFNVLETFSSIGKNYFLCYPELVQHFFNFLFFDLIETLDLLNQDFDQDNNNENLH